MYEKITPQNVIMYAIKNYDNPQCEGEKEFEDDLKRLSASQYKINQISLRIFGEKAKDYFEKRKNDLDQYKYSLIQQLIC